MRSAFIHAIAAFAAISFFSSCSKTNQPNFSGSDKLIDAKELAKIDSIAGAFGFIRSSNDFTALPRKSLTIDEFLALMKSNEVSRTRHPIIADVVTDTSSVGASGWPNYASLSGLGGGIYTAGTLSYTFDYLKSRAYPSVYQITIQINTDGGGSQHVYGIGGSTFNYSSIGSPVPPVQWAYTNTGGSASGIANSTQGFSVTCYGTETEVITILGFTYTFVYNVTFRIMNQHFAVYQTYATISLTRVN